MSDDAANVQRDNELAATAEDAAGVAAREMQKDIHTSLPGQIVSFDATTQTATVKPLIQRQLVDGTTIDIPDCQDVPVHHPRGGDIVFTLPVKAGDECLLFFSERAIDFWHENGGAQLPSEYRMHDYSDAFAFVGFSSKPKAIQNVATDAAELRTLDGATMFRLEKDTAYVGAKAGAQKSVMGEVYRTQEDLLFQALSTFASALVSACTGVLTIGQAATAINAIGPAASPLVDAIAAFEEQKATYLAGKAKVA